MMALVLPSGTIPASQFPGVDQSSDMAVHVAVCGDPATGLTVTASICAAVVVWVPLEASVSVAVTDRSTVPVNSLAGV